LNDDQARAATTGKIPAKISGKIPALRFGLSGKLLLLTVLFVMMAEILIYVPAIANFRVNWLNDRLAAAHTAALVLDAAPSGMVPESLARQILSSVGARAVAMKMGTQRRLLAVSDMPPKVDHDVDMRSLSWSRAIYDAFECLFGIDNDVMRVVGAAPMGGDFLEIVIDEAPLRNAMLRFSAILLLVSLLISGITAMHFWATLSVLGVGWNFSFVGASALVLETHRPAERNKVQAFNDFLVFGMMALGSFSSGQLLANYGWSAVNLVVFPPVLLGLTVLTLASFALALASFALVLALFALALASLTFAVTFPFA